MTKERRQGEHISRLPLERKTVSFLNVAVQGVVDSGAFSLVRAAMFITRLCLLVDGLVASRLVVALGSQTEVDEGELLGHRDRRVGAILASERFQSALAPEADVVMGVANRTRPIVTVVVFVSDVVKASVALGKGDPELFKQCTEELVEPGGVVWSILEIEENIHVEGPVACRGDFMEFFDESTEHVVFQIRQRHALEELQCNILVRRLLESNNILNCFRITLLEGDAHRGGKVCTRWREYVGNYRPQNYTY